MQDRMRTILGLLLAVLISGCSLLGENKSEILVSDRDGLDLHALPANFSSVFLKQSNSSETFCAGRMPDGMAEVSTNLKLGSKEAGSVAAGSGVAELSLGGRSPNVLIARELMYRHCELVANQKLSKSESIKLFEKILDVVRPSFLQPSTAASATTQAISSPTVGPGTAPASNPVYPQSSIYPQAPQ